MRTSRVDQVPDLTTACPTSTTTPGFQHDPHDSGQIWRFSCLSCKITSLMETTLWTRAGDSPVGQVENLTYTLLRFAKRGRD